MQGIRGRKINTTLFEVKAGNQSAVLAAWLGDINSLPVTIVSFTSHIHVLSATSALIGPTDRGVKATE